MSAGMKHRPEFHFMCGKAGAGKSTLANQLAQQHDAILLCEDIWLARLFPDEIEIFEDYIKFTRRIKTVVAPMAVELLRRQSVILDFPANTIDSRRWFRSIIEQAGCAHSLHFAVATDELCLQRIAKRNVERPEGSHELDEATFNKISSYFQPPTEQEKFNLVLHHQETACL